MCTIVDPNEFKPLTREQTKKCCFNCKYFYLAYINRGGDIVWTVGACRNKSIEGSYLIHYRNEKCRYWKRGFRLQLTSEVTENLHKKSLIVEALLQDYRKEADEANRSEMIYKLNRFK